MMSFDLFPRDDFDVLCANENGWGGDVIRSNHRVGPRINPIGHVRVQSLPGNKDRGFASAELFGFHLMCPEVIVDMLTNPEDVCLLNADAAISNDISGIDVALSILGNKHGL